MLLEVGNMAYSDSVTRYGLDTTEDNNVFNYVNRGRQKKREMSFKEHSRDISTPRLDGDIDRQSEMYSTLEIGKTGLGGRKTSSFVDKPPFWETKETDTDKREKIFTPSQLGFEGDNVVNSTLLLDTEMGEMKRKTMQVDTYNGESTAFQDYIAHFELVAEWNHWTDKEKAIQLGASLRGVAQKVLGDAPIIDRLDYDKIKTALEFRFAPKDRQAIFKTELHTRKRKKGETLREFGYSVED